VFPDFSLPDEFTGEMRTLSEYTAKGPVVVCFYRGSWCPVCNLQLKELNRQYKKIKALGAEIIGICPQAIPPETLDGKNSLTDFTLLKDAGNELGKKCGFNLVYTSRMIKLWGLFGVDLLAMNDVKEGEPLAIPTPATFIINTDNKVAYLDLSNDHLVRHDPEALQNALQVLKYNREMKENLEVEQASALKAAKAKKRQDGLEPAFVKMMKTDKQRAQFMNFLKTIYAQEGLLFWEEATKFANMKSNKKTKPIALANSAQTLYQKYIQADSDQQANLSSGLNTRLYEAIKDDPIAMEKYADAVQESAEEIMEMLYVGGYRMYKKKLAKDAKK